MNNKGLDMLSRYVSRIIAMLFLLLLCSCTKSASNSPQHTDRPPGGGYGQSDKAGSLVTDEIDPTKKSTITIDGGHFVFSPFAFESLVTASVTTHDSLHELPDGWQAVSSYTTITIVDGDGNTVSHASLPIVITLITYAPLATDDQVHVAVLDPDSGQIMGYIPAEQTVIDDGANGTASITFSSYLSSATYVAVSGHSAALKPASKIRFDPSAALQSEVMAGQSILADPLKIELLNDDGILVGGVPKAYLVPYVDAGCSVRASGGKGGAWEAEFIGGIATFSSLDYQSAEGIYLAACTSEDCSTSDFSFGKTCRESVISVRPGLVFAPVVSVGSNTFDANTLFKINVSLHDRFGNPGASGAEQVSIKACAPGSTTDNCLPTGGNLGGDLTATVVNGSASFQNLSYDESEEIVFVISVDDHGPKSVTDQFTFSQRSWLDASQLVNQPDLSSYEAATHMDRSGNVFVAYRNSNHELVMRRYDALTQTWSGDVIMNHPTMTGFYFSSHTLDTDADGNAMFAWGDDQVVYYRRYHVDSGTWSARKAIFSSTSFNFRLAMRADGNAMIVYGQLSSGKQEIKARIYSDATDEWSSEETVHAPSASHFTLQALALNDSGQGVVIWNISGGHILYAGLFNPGSGWSEFEVNTNGTIFMAHADIDAAGNVVVVWRQRVYGEVYDYIWGRAYSAQASAWGAVNQFERSTVSSMSAAFTSEGHAVIVYRWYHDLNYYVGSRRWTAADQWSEMQSLNAPGAISSHNLSFVRANGNGDAIVSWTSQVSQEPDRHSIFGARLSSDGLWADITELDPDKAAHESVSNEPHVGIDAAGNGFVLWNRTSDVSLGLWGAFFK